MIHFDLNELNKQLKDLESKMEAPDFWNDNKESAKVLTTLKQSKSKLDKFNNIKSTLTNLIDLNDLLLIEEDELLIKELLNNTSQLENDVDKLEVETLLNGKFDKNNAILTLHPGARWNRISGLGRNAV